MLMALGLFTFDMPTLPFDELARRRNWRWGTNDRFGSRPAAQYLGPGEDNVRIEGAICPEVAGDRSSIETIADMATQGESFALVDGGGRVWGDFIIVGIDNRGSMFLDNGVPRKTDFSIELQRVA